MKILRSVFALVFCLFLFTSCSSVMVSQDYDSATSFELYKNFALEQKDPDRKYNARTDNDLINKRFNNAITEQLAVKGFNKKDDLQETDFTVSYSYSIQPRIDFSNIGAQIGFSHGSYRRYGGIGSPTCTDFSKYDQGILLLDIKSTKTGEQVWRGTATDIVSIHATKEEITAQVDKMVEAVLSQFPPE